MDIGERVRTALRTAWHLSPQVCQPLPGGMTSLTWAVTAGGERYVAKLVPIAHRAGFTAGLAAAEHLTAAGITAGKPVRAVNGALVAVLDDGVLGLLRYVPGRALDRGDPADQRRWGELLGIVHRVLDGFTHPGLAGWHWVRPDAPHLDVEPWIRPAVANAVETVAATGGLTYGVLHADPAPEAFLLDSATGRTGLIDWGGAGTGPLVSGAARANQRSLVTTAGYLP